MFLDSIEIENFRPYYGKQKINTGFDDKKNLTIIMAENGNGKTSLVNALTWCLYGKELHDVKDRTEPLYNKRASRELEEQLNSGDIDLASLSVSIKMKFYDFDENGDKKFFIVTRKLIFEKFDKDSKWVISESNIIVEDNGEIIDDKNIAKTRIGNKIPQEMFQYFFFNGVTLSNYFDNNSDINLKKSIEEISQIEIIDNIYEHLNGTSKKISKEFNKKNKGAGINYMSKINDLLDEKNKLENEKRDNKNRIDIAIKNINDFKNKLSNVNSDEIKNLSKERDELEIEMENLNKEIKKNNDRYSKTILELFPLTVVFDDLVKSYEIAKIAKENKIAPPKIEKDIYNEIIKDGICICGTKLDEHPECIEVLKKRLNEVSDVTHDDFYEEYYGIKNVLGKLRDIPEINRLKDQIDKDKKSLEDSQNRHKEITKIIAGSDEEQIKRLERELTKNRYDKNELESKNERINKRLVKIDEKIKKYRNLNEQQNSLNKEVEHLNDQLIFSNDALTELSEFKKEFNRHIRNKVNKNTKEQFMDINWDGNKFIDVELDENYNLTITKKNGDKVTPADLSDGEKILLSLSFMMALHSLAGFEIPLFIDAAFEKLDKPKRIDFSRNLHAYTKNKQIIFLFTDSQYTPDVESVMSENVVNKYILERNDDITEIREI